jgi:hypothetical protein
MQNPERQVLVEEHQLPFRPIRAENAGSNLLSSRRLRARHFAITRAEAGFVPEKGRIRFKPEFDLVGLPRGGMKGPMHPGDQNHD